MKKVLGAILFLGGIAMILLSMYIKNQVVQGKLEVSDAQSKVDSGNSLFSLNPMAKEVGKTMTGSAQKKINAGQEQISMYEQRAQWLQMGGIALLVLGAGIFFIGGKRTR
jgi:hypothetical protein